jgi:hypothetical protein
VQWREACGPRAERGVGRRHAIDGTDEF